MITTTHLIIGGLELAQCLAIWAVANDVLKLKARVEATELANEFEEADERILHSESNQLREELDHIHLALKRLARSQDGSLTNWHGPKETLENVHPEFPPPGATQVFSPRAPKLPSFDLLACGHLPGECDGAALCQLSDSARQTIIDGIWGHE